MIDGGNESTTGVRKGKDEYQSPFWPMQREQGCIMHGTSAYCARQSERSLECSVLCG